MQQQFETNVCKSETGPPRIEYLRVEKPASPLVTYYLAINETARGPVAGEEWLQWQSGSEGRPFRFLDFRMGEGFVFPGEVPFETDTRIIKKLQSSEFAEKLESAEMLAVSTLGQFARHPHISVLRRFISDWHLSCLTPGNMRGIPEAAIRTGSVALGKPWNVCCKKPVITKADYQKLNWQKLSHRTWNRPAIPQKVFRVFVRHCWNWWHDKERA